MTSTDHSRRCVCPGSYDPVTAGHLDVIQRALSLFDEVVVAVLVNPAKRGLFSPEERGGFLQAALLDGDDAASGSSTLGPDSPKPDSANPDLANLAGAVSTRAAGHLRIDVVQGGLLVDYCRSIGASAVVKGLRSGTDFAYELPMALMNRRLSGLETVFLPGEPTLEHISSSLVKEVAALGGNVTGMVPERVRVALIARNAQNDDG